MANRNSLNIRRIGQPKDFWGDAYHSLQDMSWPTVLSLFFLAFLTLNTLFAGLYSLGGDCIQGAEKGSFLSLFFFSVQSFTTIGYGNLSPQTNYANILVTLEAFTGMFCTALMTGLIFAKFSLPKTRVLFSKNILFSPRDGKRSLVFRVANGRGNAIVSAKIEVTLLIDDMTEEGEKVRRIIPLKVKNQKMPVLTLSITMVHVIDETSPLWEQDLETLRERHPIIVVTVVGIDNVISQNVHAQHFYQYAEMREGEGFKDVLSSETHQGELRYVMDYTRFHDYHS